MRVANGGGVCNDELTMKNELITAREATILLGYKNRSSLTRLVQAGKISPAFKAENSGEEFFDREDVQALLTPPTTK